MVLFKQWKCFAPVYPSCLGLLGKGRKQETLKGSLTEAVSLHQYQHLRQAALSHQLSLQIAEPRGEMGTAEDCRQGSTNKATVRQERTPHRERLNLHTNCLVLLAKVAEILFQAGQVLQVAHSSINHQHHLPQEQKGRVALTQRFSFPPS